MTSRWPGGAVGEVIGCPPQGPRRHDRDASAMRISTRRTPVTGSRIGDCKSDSSGNSFFWSSAGGRFRATAAAS